MQARAHALRGLERALQQPRCNRALLHRQRRVRTPLPVAQREWLCLHQHANAIPVAPRLAMNRRNRWHVLHVRALQRLPQNRRLHLQLLRIHRVLILAAATCAEVRTRRCRPPRRRFQHRVQLRMREAPPFIGDVRFHLLARQRERHKHRLARRFARLGARQPRPAVDRFLDLQPHAWLM